MKTLFLNWVQIAKRNKRLFAWLSGALALIFLLDFSLRVFVARDDELRKFLAPVVHPLANSTGMEAIRARLEAALPAPPPAEELAAAQPREIALQGVFISKRSRVAALVLLPQGNKPLERRNVGLGGEIDGWTVERVEVSRVALKKGSETKELVMFRVR